MPEFAYSHNEERYVGTFPTREAAFKEGCDESTPGDNLWVAEIVPIDLESITPTRISDDVVDRINENLSQEVGEAAEDQPRANGDDMRELDAKLRAVVKEWLAGRVTYFSVTKAEKMTVPEGEPAEPLQVP